MTYFAFLAYFVLSPIILLAIALWLTNSREANQAFLTRLIPFGILLHVVLALTYTTPWDNYLVKTGVWSYNPQLVTGIVFGYVPIEEYTFFVGETILSGLFWWLLTRFVGASDKNIFRPNKKINQIASLVLGIFWLFFTIQFFWGGQQWNYLGIIFFWALPPILLQMIFGADILWHHRGLVISSILIPGAYLSLMDIIALRATTWQISSSQTLGILYFNILPIEEVTFFLVTNALIAVGLTLMTSVEGQKRLEHIRTSLLPDRRG